jgi:hypothetical protein
MRAYATSLVVAATLAALAIVVVRTARDIATPAMVSSFQANEVARVRAHFDSVLLELTVRRDSQLTLEQRDRRAALMTALRAYAERGEFPKNYDFPSRQVPYFVDRKTGVRCAVAYLLESTGRTDIVRRVAATNNNVRVPQLATDTAFTAWVDASGLTLAEAARIQPSYRQDQTRERDQYTMVSAVAITTSLAATFLNLTANRDGQSRLASGTGLFVGSATFGLGLLGQLSTTARKEIGIINLGAGTASTIAAVRSVIRRNRGTGVASARDTTELVPTGPRRATITPTFSLVGQKAAGVAVNLRF